MGNVIAFLSARSKIHAQMAGYDAGGDDYISKPIAPKQLIKRIKDLLNRNKNVG
ncbi:MAG: DNA-binding response regulator [Bacteroidia bacterium]|nr:MAG: DNA-binding response regulator [Bacteroidia bacterium]